MKMYESVAKMEMDQQTTCKNGYIKDINAEIVLTRTCLRITDLTNALKVGKTCKEFVLYFENYNQNFYMVFTDYVYNNKLNLETIVKNILAFNFDIELSDEFHVDVRENKGVETFSPFAVIKPLTKVPTKWNKTNIVKAILSGQIFKATKVSHFTDDYAYDGAVNYGKGTNLDVLEMARDFINSPDGWKFRMDKEENGMAEISADCYHYDYNTLYFDINCNTREQAQEIVKAEEQEKEDNNNKLENECIKVNIEDLNKDAVYQVEYLEMNDNTKEYETRTEIINYYGLVNQEYNEVWSRFWHILKLEVVNINDSDTFKIADIRDYDIDTIKTNNNFIVSMLGIYLTGKSLKEYNKNGYSLSNIRKVDSQRLLEDIFKEKAGTMFSLFPTDKEKEIKNIDMLERFKNELKRAS